MRRRGYRTGHAEARETHHAEAREARAGLELIRKGAPGIHFYTLNRSPATRRVMSWLRDRL